MHVIHRLAKKTLKEFNNIYLGVWLGDGGSDLEEEQVFGAERECAEPARLKPATSALMAPPPAKEDLVYLTLEASQLDAFSIGE